MAITPTQMLRYETRGRKAYITLTRPEVMNALNSEIVHAIGEAIREFGNDNNLLVAIITGAGGRAFSAGMDLKETSQRDQRAMGAGTGRQGGATGRLRRIGELPQANHRRDRRLLPGRGPGNHDQLRHSHRHRTVRFGLPEARRSLIPGPGVQLSRQIPMGEALLILLTGGHVSAERMYQLGYIQRLVPDREALFKQADAIADEIIQCAPLAVQALKRIIKVGHSLPVPVLEQMSEPIRAAIERTEDRREGPLAFVEKRAPVWKMR